MMQQNPACFPAKFCGFGIWFWLLWFTCVFFVCLYTLWFVLCYWKLHGKTTCGFVTIFCSFVMWFSAMLLVQVKYMLSMCFTCKSCAVFKSSQIWYNTKRPKKAWKIIKVDDCSIASLVKEKPFTTSSGVNTEEVVISLSKSTIKRGR